MKSVNPYAAMYPRQYVALRAPPPPPPHPPSSSSTLDESPGSLPVATTATTIDGDLDKPFWTDVDWTDDFVDIATDTLPGFRTKAKMRWDDEFLYVGGCVCVCVPSCCFRGASSGVFLAPTSLSHSIIFYFVPNLIPLRTGAYLVSSLRRDTLASISIIACAEADPVPSSFFHAAAPLSFVFFFLFFLPR